MKKPNVLQICLCSLLIVAVCGHSLAGQRRPGKGWVRTGELGAAPRRVTNDYHTYGLEWDSEEIKWYFDGVFVRRMDNTHWHQPLTLNFDSETMPKWFGLPRDSDLPSVYSIEYVRAWKKSDADSFVQVSPRDERYFELSNGIPHVPIGLNMIAPWGRDEKEALATMERWIKALSENRGNYIRLWLSHNFFDIEHERSGQYDGEKAKRIDAVLQMARRHNVRVKMTVEHFRHFFRDRQQWAAKPIHHVSRGDPAKDIDDFFQGQKSREQFKKKLRWYADRYGDDPIIFAWELWNEMDTVRGKGYMEWTEEMLAELKKLFPKNLATQSLGSFDNASKRPRYRRVSLMKDNDFANVHRYLDLGASLEICKGPVDLMAADAIRELQNFECLRPIILAESGAVEPSHTGPFKLYKADKAGIILHDVIFAPFFAGAAGTGQNWHWDHYVAANDLWFQFDRFAETIEGIDPPAEAFEPITIDHSRLRIYALNGRHTLLLWCRDKQNTWETELAQRESPAMVSDTVVSVPDVGRDLNGVAVDLYDPWSNRWTQGSIEGGGISLPDFTRSIVVKIRYRSR